MSIRKICPTCKGQKNIQTLGYMVKKCNNCQGVGHVSFAESPKREDSERLPEALVVRRRGRPPKNSGV